MARSTLEILLDSIKDPEEQSADFLPRLPQRPLSRARLPSSRSTRMLSLLPSDRNLHSSASYSHRRSSDPCLSLSTASDEPLHSSALTNGSSASYTAAGSRHEETIERTVLNVVTTTQETLDQASSIAERKMEKDSTVEERKMLEKVPANGSSDPCPFYATDDMYQFQSNEGEMRIEQTEHDTNCMIMIQESLDQSPIATLSNPEKDNRNKSSLQIRTEDLGLEEGDSILQSGKNSPAQEMTIAEEATIPQNGKHSSAQMGTDDMDMAGEDTILQIAKDSSMQMRTEEMAMAEEYAMKGRKVWFLNQDSRWTQGILHSTCGTEAMVSQPDDQVVRMLSNRVLPANPDILDDVDDLVQLSYINEPSILHTLRRRYGLGKSYTRSGSMLIAIGSSTEQLNGNGNGLQVPKPRCSHVHAIANNAFEAMRRDGTNQSIILSGNNKAAKYSLLRLTLQNLASRGGNPVLEKRLLLVPQILEAFVYVAPSSKTTGSCVGEMINLFYDESEALLGAEWRTVLFEELRVVHQDKGEQTYNIFYQLCEGADPVLKDKLNLMGTREFNYLNQMGLDHMNGSSYHSQFQSVIDSLYAFGISSQEQEHIFTMLAAILWIGNLTLPTLNYESQALKNAANLLRCSREQLLQALSPISCDSVEMIAARDLLARSIYERLIWWLMKRINKVLKSGLYGDYRSINVVNMPCFGLSQRTGPDGLLVNYSHEYLQHFIQCHLSQLEEEDSICREHRTGSAQNHVVEFLEQALFPLLENIPNSENSGFTSRLRTLIDNSDCCKQKNIQEFSISHIFGEVTYDTTRFEKVFCNFDGHNFLQTSKSCMPELLYFSEKNDMDAHHTSTPVNSESEGTLSSRCQEWIQQVLQQLKNGSVFCIFSIMPSKLSLKNIFEEEFVLQQLRLNRVTEFTNLSRTNYSEQISHELFANRFGMLVAPNVNTDKDTLGICIEVLQRFNVPPYMYHVGLRNLFFYPGQVDKLEQAKQKHVQQVVAVQKTYRGYKAWCSFKKQKEASIYLQASIRGWLVRKSIAHQTVEKNVISRTSENESVEGHENNVITEETEVKSFLEPTVQASTEKEAYDADEELHMRKDDMQGEKEHILVSLQRKEAENIILQHTVKEYERKWTTYEAKMKSMEEMWTKQIAALQKSLNAAKTVVEEQSSLQEKHNEEDDSSVHRSSYENLEGNTAEIPPLRESDASRSVLDPSRSVIDRLSKELEHRTQVFDDDAHFLVEVKSGQIEASFKPEAELHRLRIRFEVWKKDFKGRLRETKNMLKKLGKSEPAEKKKKKWWSGW